MSKIKLGEGVFKVDYQGTPTINYSTGKTIEIQDLQTFEVIVPKGWDLEREGSRLTFIAYPDKSEILNTNKIFISDGKSQAEVALVGEQIWNVDGQCICFPDLVKKIVS